MTGVVGVLVAIGVSFRWVLAVVSGVVDFAMVSVYLVASDVETAIFVEAAGDDGVVSEASLNGDTSEVKGAQDKRFDSCHLTQPDCFRCTAHNFVVVDAFARMIDADDGFNRHERLGLFHERFLFRLVHNVPSRLKCDVHVGADHAFVVDAAHDYVPDLG